MATTVVLPCINHCVRAGDVNLLQVAGYVRDPKQARRLVERAINELGLEPRTDKKIRGCGKAVIVGTYEESIKIAEHLGGSKERLDAIKDALKGVKPEPEILAEDPQQRDEDDEVLDVTLFPTADEVTTLTRSMDKHPVKLTKEVSAWLEFSRLKDAREKVREAVADEDIAWEVDVIDEPCGRNPLTGRLETVYAFTVDGFKEFCMSCSTPKAKKVRKYFITVEKEYNKVVPELKKTQEEVDRLQEENERLRREKDVASNYQRWRETREDGITAHRTTMKRLQHIVEGISESGSAKLYAIVGDAINRAVLDFQEKNTTAFKSSMNYDKSLSVPDVLDDLALRERQATMERFMRFFEDKGPVLRELPLEVVIRKVYEFAEWQRLANAQAGDLKKKHLLSNGEAKMRKRKRKEDIKAERLAGPAPPPANVTVNATQATINNYFARAS